MGLAGWLLRPFVCAERAARSSPPLLKSSSEESSDEEDMSLDDEAALRRARGWTMALAVPFLPVSIGCPE